MMKSRIIRFLMILSVSLRCGGVSPASDGDSDNNQALARGQPQVVAADEPAAPVAAVAVDTTPATTTTTTTTTTTKDSRVVTSTPETDTRAVHPVHPVGDADEDADGDGDDDEDEDPSEGDGEGGDVLRRVAWGRPKPPKPSVAGEMHLVEAQILVTIEGFDPGDLTLAEEAFMEDSMKFSFNTANSKNDYVALSSHFMSKMSIDDDDGTGGPSSLHDAVGAEGDEGDTADTTKEDPQTYLRKKRRRRGRRRGSYNYNQGFGCRYCGKNRRFVGDVIGSTSSSHATGKKDADDSGIPNHLVENGGGGGGGGRGATGPFADDDTGTTTTTTTDRRALGSLEFPRTAKIGFYPTEGMMTAWEAALQNVLMESRYDIFQDITKLSIEVED